MNRLFPAQLKWPSLCNHLGQLLVGNDDGDLPTSSNCPASSILCSISSALGGASLAGDGACTGEGGLLPFPAIIITVLILTTLVSPPLSLFLGVTYVLTILEFRRGRLVNEEAVRARSHESCVAAILNF